MAVEDGVALAEVLQHVYTKSELSSRLRMLERVRMTRTQQMQQASVLWGAIHHLPDSAEQKARDVAMKAGNERSDIHTPNLWNDPTTQRWSYGYEVVEEIRRACREIFQ